MHIKYDMNLDEIRNSKHMHHSGAHKILKRNDLTLECRRDPLVMEKTLWAFYGTNYWKIYCASHIQVGREKSTNSTKHEFSTVYNSLSVFSVLVIMTGNKLVLIKVHDLKFHKD